MLGREHCLPLVALATARDHRTQHSFGAFSLRPHAVQLAIPPDERILRPSGARTIYIPEVNRALMIGAFSLLGFRSVNNLGAAYGIAVTGPWRSRRFSLCARTVAWITGASRKPLHSAGSSSRSTCVLRSNALKIMHGGWVPSLLAIGIFTAA